MDMVCKLMIDEGIFVGIFFGVVVVVVKCFVECLENKDKVVVVFLVSGIECYLSSFLFVGVFDE